MRKIFYLLIFTPFIISCNNFDVKKIKNKIDSIENLENRIQDLELENQKLLKYLVEKASISINGVSLTLSKVAKRHFEINVIPHTLKLTNLKNLKRNDIVNVELDIFGKYIYKLSE